MLKGNDLESKKYFLFDIDGTLAIDDMIYNGSQELLDYIESIGGRTIRSKAEKIILRNLRNGTFPQ